MRNMDIQEAFINTKVKKWMVAEILGISDVTFSKRLRKELSKIEKDKIFEAIKKVELSSEEGEMI